MMKKISYLVIGVAVLAVCVLPVGAAGTLVLVDSGSNVPTDAVQMAISASVTGTISMAQETTGQSRIWPGL